MGAVFTNTGSDSSTWQTLVGDALFARAFVGIDDCSDNDENGDTPTVGYGVGSLWREANKRGDPGRLRQ